MNEKNYELKITPKIEKWLEKISPDGKVFDKVLEFLIDELESNPYKRQNNPKLIDSIKGLKCKNPPFWRIRIGKELGIDRNYRIFYSIKECPVSNKCYVVLVDYSGVDDKSKKRTVERLKKITVVKFENILEEILTGFSMLIEDINNFLLDLFVFIINKNSHTKLTKFSY